MGFRPIRGWECVWKHDGLGLFISVFVDDFKMAGPSDKMKQGWDLIRQSGIEIDPPEPFNQYLGCGQDTWTVPDDVFEKRMSSLRPMLKKYNGNLN